LKRKNLQDEFFVNSIYSVYSMPIAKKKSYIQMLFMDTNDNSKSLGDVYRVLLDSLAQNFTFRPFTQVALAFRMKLRLLGGFVT